MKRILSIIIILSFVFIAFLAVNRYGKKIINKSAAISSQKTLTDEINITVDAGKVIGNHKPFYHGLGMGSFNEGTLQPFNRSFFQLLVESNQERRLVNYVNMKSIFKDRPEKRGSDDGAHVVERDPSGKIIYHWDIVDAVLDAFVRDGLKPIISFTFMPKSMASDPKRVNPWHKAIVSPPQNYQEWRELIFQTVLHLKERYGSSTIANWYFEVWNEPDLFEYFWIRHPDRKQYPDQSHHEAYCKLYDFSVDGALSADANIKIGGPGLAGDRRFLREFLKHCYAGQNNVNGRIGTRIDFISRHHYGEIEERIIPQYVSFINEVKSISGEAFKNLEILITETGPSAQPKPWLNDRYVAAWIVKEVDAFLSLADQYGDDYLPDIMCFWSKPVASIFGNQFGLATGLGNKHNPSPESIVKRPAFNGLRAVSWLGERRLELIGTNFGDLIHGIATKCDDASIVVVLYHLLENDTFNKKFSEHKIKLKIVGCDQPEYTMEYYGVDETHSNGFKLWKRMGSPQYPSRDQLALLQSGDDLELIEPINKVKMENGEFTKEIQLQNNSIAFIRLSRSDDRFPPNRPVDLKVLWNESKQSVALRWSPPQIAGDGDQAASYLIFRNGTLIAKQFSNTFEDNDVVDDSKYSYRIFAVDNAGNQSDAAAEHSVTIPIDTAEPRVINIRMPDEESIAIYFDELLNNSTANQTVNYSIEPQMMVENASYDEKSGFVLLKTKEHVKNKEYLLEIRNIQDRAKVPNTIQTNRYPYKYVISYHDSFDRNTLADYIWSHSGAPSSYYDQSNEQLVVLTGEDTRLKFSHRLPKTDRGTFQFIFSPLIQYPDGGAISIVLRENEKNYYRVNQTDGYGAGKIEKIVSGDVVESHSFRNEYEQKRKYILKMNFTPHMFRVDAFDEELYLEKHSHAIEVREFEIELVQQDATFDDFEFSGE